VFGAEQWPECVNPITYCASASWTQYTVLQHVLPRAMQLDAAGNFVASALLLEAPTLANGGLTQNPFTVTFHINPGALWDDGSPITSEDFQFTWRAQLSTHGAYDAEGYEHIRSVGTLDPTTAIIRFRDVDSDWADRFGGLQDYVLEAAAFPDVDPDHPDLSERMQDDIPFSGGPFRLVEWSQDRAVLERNDIYFGRHALLDRVTFLPAFDQDVEFKDLLGGRVSAIFPQMSFGGLTPDALTSDPAVQVVAGDGIYFEALWMNHSKPPLDDPRVREALMYAIDRQSVVDKVVRPFDPNAKVLNCGFVAFPRIGPWCRTRPFERFTYDPARARAILEADGYVCADGPCTKDAATLEIEYWAHTLSPRLKATQELVIERARAAGFSLVPREFESAGFFDIRNTPLADYGSGGLVDPSVTHLFGCQEIPRREIDVSGDNYIHWCDDHADRLMRSADREADPDRRLDLMEAVYQLEADDFISLPLYVLPATSAWRMDRIAGPIGAFNSSPYGLFFNMNEWYVP
jgi:peptide/nickel transport system substrate-binding protein